MDRPSFLVHRFEPLLDWGNDLTSLWGPFRRRLPPKDVKIRAPFAVLWTGSYLIAGVVGVLAALTVELMYLGRFNWHPAVTSGRSSLLSVASFYATWLSHHYGFLIYCLAPALIVMVNALIIGAWNRRARRLQREGTSQEPEPAASDGTWPPPPIYRK